MERKLKALVVDDEPSVGDALRLILEEAGYEAVVERSGHSGIGRLDEGAFDVLITDLRLPDMSGIDLLRRAAQKERASRMIMITAFSITAAVRDEALALGAMAVLAKPFSPSTVLDLVTRPSPARRAEREA